MGGTSQNEDTMKVWLCIFALWHLRNWHKNSWWFDQQRHWSMFSPKRKKKNLAKVSTTTARPAVLCLCHCSHFWPLSVNVAVNCAFSIIIANYCNPYWCQWTRQFDAASMLVLWSGLCLVSEPCNSSIYVYPFYTHTLITHAIFPISHMSIVPVLLWLEPAHLSLWILLSFQQRQQTFLVKLLGSRRCIGLMETHLYCVLSDVPPMATHTWWRCTCVHVQGLR